MASPEQARTDQARHSHGSSDGHRTAALQRVGMAGVGKRVFARLSGGEKQRVQVARALAQQTGLLVLDEPTNHLDIRFQLELLDLVRGLRLTAIAAMHDLNLAASRCDRLCVLQAGTVGATGRVGEVLTPALVADVLGMRLHRFTDPETGRVYLGAGRLEFDCALPLPVTNEEGA